MTASLPVIVGAMAALKRYELGPPHTVPDWSGYPSIPGTAASSYHLTTAPAGTLGS